MLPIIIPAHLVKTLVKKDSEEDAWMIHYRDTIMKKIISACLEDDNQTWFASDVRLSEYTLDRLKRMFEAQGYKVVLLDNTLVFTW